MQQRLSEATALQQKGSLREAQKLYESLLPELRERKADLGWALSALTEIASALGEYDLALARGRKAADVYRELGDENGRTRALNLLGTVGLYRGDYAQALANFEEALRLARATGQREEEVKELNNIGTVLFPQAKYLDALHAYQSALERVEAAAGAPWYARRKRLTLVNLGTLFLRLGSYDQALEVYLQAQRSPETLAPSEQARLLANLGVLYRRLEDPLKALETYRAAEQLFAKDRHRDGELGVLKNIGIVQALDLGNLQAALGTFSKALSLAQESGNRREAMQARLYRGETLLRLGKLDDASADLEAAFESAAALKTTEEQWKALYGLGRIGLKRGQDELAAVRFRQAISIIESVRGSLQLAKLKTDFLADKRDVYDALVELLADRPDATEIFDLLERSRSRTFQDRLRERAGGGPSAALVLPAIQARLDPHSLLLEYWVTPRAAAVVWVTQRASGIARIPFSPDTAAEVAAFTEDLSSESGDGWRRASETLGKRLLSGIEPLGWPELRHVIVVADGPLSALPFEVLQPPAAPGTLLVERFDVSYAPAAALLLHEDRPALGSWSLPWKRRLIAFGDPVVSAQSGDALPVEAPRARLATSAEEVREIARLSGGRADIHLGAASSKKRLLQGEARGVPLLHLSTHATADDANPERSRILFSPASPGGGPDYLFLREVYDLDLRGVDLATLSACDTERGKVIRGEGLQGFSRALLSAGSRATVTTLWRVADKPATEFMKQLYFELGNREPKAEALRLAKLRFLRSGTALRHPRFWAAFVLNGDGLRPVPRPIPWTGLLAPAALALLALAAVSGRRTRRAGRATVPAGA